MDPLSEIAELLFDGGSLAYEEISKKAALTPEQQDKRKRALTAGLSAVGASAGAAGLGVGGNNLRRSYKKVRGAQKGITRLKSVKAAVGNEKLATSLIPLEVAGLGGEIMSTKILHADAQKPIKKSGPDQADIHAPGVGTFKSKKTLDEIPTGKVQGKLKLMSHAERIARKRYQQQVSKSDLDIVWEGEFSKVNSDKQQVFGWASVVEMDGEPIVDLQGDYISIDEVEKAGYEYVIKSRKGGNQHAREGENPRHVSDMIESFIVTPEKIEKMGLPETMPIGWWVGFQVNDPDAWSDVRSGKRTGFSIHGRGQRA